MIYGTIPFPSYESDTRKNQNTINNMSGPLNPDPAICTYELGMADEFTKRGLVIFLNYHLVALQ